MTAFEKLWPARIWPEIVIVTGPYGCGKTTFALSTGAEPARILDLDFEKSGKLFAQQIGFAYRDIPSVAEKKHPSGWKGHELYAIVDEELNAVKAGEYDVLILDNASPLEDAIAAQVDKNPNLYGLSPNQLAKSGGLRWGAIKNAYMQFIVRHASKFKMIFIVVHLRDKWAGDSVVKDAYGKPVQEPKGKETLEQLSSLFLWLEHGPGGTPSANVLKCRLDRKVWIADPDNPSEDIPAEKIAALGGAPGIVTIPMLPLRLPKATWPEIRNYMERPANLSKPRAGEVPSQKAMSEDDRLRLRSIIAQNEATVAEAEKERLSAAERAKHEAETNARKQKFIREAVQLGYVTDKGQTDLAAIFKIVGAFDEARYDQQLEQLKAAKNGQPA